MKKITIVEREVDYPTFGMWDGEGDDKAWVALDPSDEQGWNSLVETLDMSDAFADSLYEFVNDLKGAMAADLDSLWEKYESLQDQIDALNR